MQKRCLSLVVVLLLASAVAAFAEDLWPPDGRGGDGTIFAEWDTWVKSPSPDTWSHGEGMVVYRTPWIATYPSSTLLSTYENRNDVLKFLAGPGPDVDSYLMIYLPNFEEPPADALGKGVGVQIT